MNPQSTQGDSAPTRGEELVPLGVLKTSAGVSMPPLQRQIQLSFSHTVYFTENLFHPTNPVLGQVLLPEPAGRKPKILLVLDEGLQAARPELSSMMEAYFGQMA